MVEAGLKTDEAKFFYRGGFQPWIGVRGDALRVFAEKESAQVGSHYEALTKIEPQ